MYKVLIVDDEAIVRKGLRVLAQWSCYSFAIEGEAENGIQALEMIKSKMFDLVVMDIRMPKMDGIEVAKFIFENMADLKVILISGYKDFDYARNAIEYGVVNYLLKPVSKELLEKTLSRVKSELDAQHGRDPVHLAAIPEDTLDDKVNSYLTKRRIEKYIEENYSDEINLKSLANRLNYNHVYFGRLFARIMEMNFTEYLNKYRVEKAAEMILESNFRINDICRLVGYSDVNYFCGIFKKYRGVTPSQYKLERRKATDE